MPTANTNRRPPPAVTRSLATLLVAVLLVLFAVSAMSRAQTATVGLGTAGDFAVLAGETITNTGPTTITGDVGLHPGTAVTGFDSVTLTGDQHIADAVAEQAKQDLVTAYDAAAGPEPTVLDSPQLGDRELLAGVYASEAGTLQLTGTVTLDAEGDPDAVFVFQAESTLTTASASTVNLVNGADPCNVFWQVGSSATLGTGTTFAGNILALTSIALQTGTTVEGRALARNGEVTLDTNTITQAACATANGDDGTDDDADAEGDADDDESTPTEDDTPSDGDDGTPTDGDDGTPTQVPPPTRIDTGGGGSA